MLDCSSYLKKFYLGVGLFFIMAFMRTFLKLPTGLVIVLALILLIAIILLIGPYLKCLEKRLKK
jgi:hypothetical protein